MKNFLLILTVILTLVFCGCMDTTKVIEQPIEEEIAQTDTWEPEPQVRVRVRITDNATPITGYSSGIRNDSIVYQIIKTAYLNNSFRTRTGSEWWLDYFPPFIAFKAEVQESDIILVAWNREAGKLTTFDDGEAIEWLTSGYNSNPLWIDAQYASSIYDARRANYLGNKWKNSHKKYSGNHLYVLKRMVNFE